MRGSSLTRALAPAAIALAYGALLAQWARVWSLTPDRSWGWAILPLSAYFFWLRRRDAPPPAVPARTPAAMTAGVVLGLGAYGITRLWLEPFPGWPLMEWVFAASALWLGWFVIRQSEGSARASHFVFPIAWGLAALPWPAAIQVGLIGTLRQGLAHAVAAGMTLAGTPAIGTGTVIEVGRGAVGIDEACGGIQSLETGVLVALAIGELRRDRWGWRLYWLLAAGGIAIFFNTARIWVLAAACARGGAAAVARWHDPAATGEMVLTLAALGLLALTVGPRPALAPKAGLAARSCPAPEAAHGKRPVAWPVLIGAVVLGSEAWVALWYGPGARAASYDGGWTAHLPSQLPSYEAFPYTATMDELLHADGHELGRWRDANGARREGFVLSWNRGQTAEYVLNQHNPDICIPFNGSSLLGAGPLVDIPAPDGRTLPFQSRRFRGGSGDFSVFFLFWDVTDQRPLRGNGPFSVVTPARSWAARWLEVREHRRALAARSVAIAIYDAPTPEAAAGALRAELATILEDSVSAQPSGLMGK